MSAFLGGYLQQHDHATLSATFVGAKGDRLGQTTLGPVTVENRGGRSALLQVSQGGILPKGTRTVAFQLDMTGIDGSYNDGYADNLSFRLDRQGFVESLFRRPILLLRPDQPSALRGQPILLNVFLGYGPDIIGFAERDVVVKLEADGAQIEPEQVTISSGASFAQAKVLTSRPGALDLRASSPGFEPAQRQVYSCDEGVVEDLKFPTTQQRTFSGGSEIRFDLVLTDKADHPVTDRHPKVIEIEHRGVGELGTKNGSVPAEKCAHENTITSATPGTANIKATFGTASREREFLFTLPLSARLLFVVLGGGIAGAFIRAALIWERSRRWNLARWAVFLASGALIGVFFFLACYYGLAKASPMLSIDEGLAFFLGIVGGYLGEIAMDRITGQMLPPKRRSA